MHGAGIALALTLASFLSTGAALAERGINFDLYRIESVTEDLPIQYVPMFDGAECPVDGSTVKNLLRAELQRDRGIKLRFVFMREFDERKKELYDRPTKFLKQFPANFDFWKDALREANRYGSMPVLMYTVRTARIEETCLAFIEAKLTTFVPLRGPSRYVTFELWSRGESVHVPKANYTASIAAAATSIWLQFVDEWKQTQAFCVAQAPWCEHIVDDSSR
jgi:hypothetical protein